MKRFFIYIIFLLPVFISGCNKTNKQIPVEVIIQRKADSIAKAATLECLFYPETYDPIKTQVDSISGSVYITPKIVNAAIQIIKLKKEREPIYSNYKQAKESADFWKGTDSKFYRKYKEDMNDETKRLKDIDNEIQHYNNVVLAFRDELNSNDFYGYSIFHRFRSGTDAGTKRINELLIITDKKLDCWTLRITLDEDNIYNFKNIKKTIDEVLESENGSNIIN